MRPMTAACALALLAVLAPSAVAEPTTVTLEFDRECLDLDAGAIEVDCNEPTDDEATWDVLVSYHADRGVHAVLAQNERNAVEIAHLIGRTFADVTADDVAGAPFTTALVDEALGADRVVLVRTELGDVFKLGNPVEDGVAVTFDTERL